MEMPGLPYNEKICPICGKDFVCVYESSWAYKMQHYNTKYVLCSWKCLQEQRRKIEGKGTRRGRKKKGCV